MNRFGMDWSDPTTRRRLLIGGGIAVAVALVVVVLLVWPGVVAGGGTRTFQCRIANCTNETVVKVDGSGNPVDGTPICHGPMMPKR